MPTRFKRFITTHRIAIGIGVFLLSLTIAVIYLFVVPEQAAQATGLTKLVLLYGHSLCWVFIAVATVVWMRQPTSVWVKRLAYAGLASYAIFMATLVLSSI